MSKSGVDTRVVRMEFDNAKFEKNVKQTTKSLDKLNQSMDFHDADKGLEKVRLKISAMETAATAAIANITTRVVNLGIRLVKSLSVDNIAAGWAKYGEKTTSVATMIAQKIRIAGKEIEDQAKKLEVVNKQLEILSWFSDETSYSFTDMVNNVGKFTAAGQDLDVSVKAMEGIATWAALSGQNASTASRAMYQLAQAMGKGKIQKIDWMSIQNANMDTEEFRETVLKTAVAMNELTQEGDDFVTKTGKKFKQAQFAEFLSEGWFTSDVLVKSLSKYSAAVEQIFEIAQRTGKPASEIIEEFGDQLDVFGLKAFKAAQEARTFTDVLNSVKDAVSSKWMKTFENIFGGQEEAVKLWTDLANELYDMFAESGNFRNNVLGVWNSLGGHDDLFAKGGDSQGAFWNIYDAIVALKNLIKSAWNTVFPLSELENENDQAQEIGRNLKQITNNIKSFSERVLNTVNYAGNLTRVFKILFNGLKFGLQVIQAIRYAVDPIIETVKQLAGRLSDEILYYMERFSLDGSVIESIAIRLHDVIEDLLSVINVEDVLEIVLTLVRGVIDVVSNLLKLLSKAAPIIKTVTKFIIELIHKFLELPKMFNDFLKDKTGKGLIEHIESFFDSIISVFNAFNKNEQKVLNTSKKMAKKAAAPGASGDSSEEDGGNTVLSPIMVFINGIVDLCKGLGTFLAGAIALVGKVLSVIGNGLAKIGNILKNAFTKTEDTKKTMSPFAKTLIAILIPLTVIIGLIIAIGTVLNNAAWNLMAMINPLGNISDALSDMAIAKKLESFALIIREASTALLKVMLAFVLFEGLSDQTKQIIGTIVVIAGIVAAILLIKQQIKNVTDAAMEATKTFGGAAKTTRSIKDSIAGLFDSGSELIQSLQQNSMLMQITSLVYTFGNLMLKMALAFAIFDQISWDGMLKGLAALGTVTILFMGIMAFSKVAKNSSVDIKSTKASFKDMIALTLVIKTMGKAMSGLASLGWEGVGIALTAIAGVMALFFGLAVMVTMYGGKTMEEGSKILFKSMLGFSAGLLAMSITMRSLSGVGWSNIGKTFTIIAGALLSLAALFVVTKLFEKLNSKAFINMFIGLATIMGSILVFGLVAKMMNNVPWESIGKTFVIAFGALLSLGALFVVAKLFEKLKPSSFIPVFIGLATIMTSLLIFGVAAKAMDAVPWAAIGKTFVVAFGALLSLATLLIIIKNIGIDPVYMIQIAGALAIFSLALIPFGNAIMFIGTLKWSAIAKGLLLIAGTFIILGATAAIVKNFVPVVIALSLAIAILSISAIAAGIGLQQIAIGMSMLSEAIGPAMEMFVTAFAEFGPPFFEALGESISNMFAGIINGAARLLPAITNLIVQLILSLSEIVKTALPSLLEALVSLLDDILATLAAHAPSIAESVVTILTNVLAAFDERFDEIADHIFSMLHQLLVKFNDWIPSLVKDIVNIIMSLLKALVNELGPKLPEILQLIVKFIGQVLDAILKVAVPLAGMITKVLLVLIGLALELLIHSLGALAKMFLNLVVAVLNILYETFISLLKVVGIMLKKIIIEVVILLNDALAFVGRLIPIMLVSGFSAFVGGLLQGFVDILDAYNLGWVADALGIRKAADTMLKASGDMLGALRAQAGNMQDAIQEASKNITNTVNTATSGISGAVQEAFDGINDSVNSATEGMSDAMSDFGEQIGGDFGSGLADGIAHSSGGASSAAEDMMDETVESAKDEAEIHSPSRVMMRIGEYLIEGLNIGIQNGTDSMMDNMSRALNSTIGLAEDIMSDEEGNDITLVVGLDTSNVESQAAKVNDIMSGITNPELSFYGQNADNIARSSRRTRSLEQSEGKSTIDKSNNVTYNNTFNISAENAQETADEIDKKLKEQSLRAKFAKGGI